MLNKFMLTVALIIAAAALAGCGNPRPPGPQAGRVDQISLLPSPVAENFDDQPGPDGISIRMYLYQIDQPLPIAASGDIEFILYEGVVSPDALASARPFHTWSFTADELRPFFRPDEFGLWSYQFALRWARPPATALATLAARCLPPAGMPFYSAPTTIVISQP